MRRSVNRCAGLSWLVVGIAACGSDPVAVDPAVAPFVGTWDAVVLTVIADAPPNIVADVLATGGSFWISVEPSGQYTATLEFIGLFSSESFGLIGKPAPYPF